MFCYNLPHHRHPAGGSLGIGRLYPRRLRNRKTVLQDWIGHLPAEKLEAFLQSTQNWNSEYSIASVTLNEALDLFHEGRVREARQEVGFSADVVARLALLLVRACEVMEKDVRHFAELPTVEPLRQSNFRLPESQKAASWNGLMHKVLFAARNQYFYKLRALSALVEYLASEFQENVDAIYRGHLQSRASGRAWSMLEPLHHDLNICLRESEVVLKSFLRALPSPMVSGVRMRLEATIETPPRAVRPRVTRVSA